MLTMIRQLIALLCLSFFAWRLVRAPARPTKAVEGLLRLHGAHRRGARVRVRNQTMAFLPMSARRLDRFAYG